MNCKVTIDYAILEWLGYENEQVNDKKGTFIKLLKSHDVQFKQIKHTDPEFINYPELVDEAKQYTIQALNSKQWIIMNSRDFKEMVMCLRTKKAGQIRKYYLSLEDLFKMYCEYTTHFKNRQLKEKDRQIKAVGEDLHVARNVVAPPAPHESQKHCFTIFEMSPSYVPFESDPKYIRVNKPNVIIGRCQNKSLNGRFKEIKRYGDGTNKNAQIIKKIPSPNAINLNNHLRQWLKENASDLYTFCAPSGIVINDGGSLDELVDIIQKVHDKRMVYGSARGVAYPYIG